MRICSAVTVVLDAEAVVSWASAVTGTSRDPAVAAATCRKPRRLREFSFSFISNSFRLKFVAFAIGGNQGKFTFHAGLGVAMLHAQYAFESLVVQVTENVFVVNFT